MRQKILFVVNPISGGLRKTHFPSLIHAILDTRRYEYDIAIWDKKSAYDLSREALLAGFEVVVAVGGDGTIHQVAAALKGTETAMGIIPMGSGNGLARHLRIPLQPERAVRLLNIASVHPMDVVKMNNRHFVNVAGVGFDAEVSRRFAQAGRRGFYTYISETFKEFVSYKAEEYEIEINGKKLIRKAFLISFANGSQWGNNAIIAPEAMTDDGLIDMVIMKEMPWHAAPATAMNLFSGNISKTKGVEIIRGEQFSIKRKNPGTVHLDGEPFDEGDGISLEVIPGSLNVIF